MIDFKVLARKAGATDEHGGMATTTFCFTESEFEEFVRKIGQAACNVIKAEEDEAQREQTYLGDDPPAIVLCLAIKKEFGLRNPKV